MPTACSSLSAGYYRSSECGVASGVKRLWVANYNAASTWSANTSFEIVSGSTNVPTFLPVEIRQGTCSWNEEFVVNQQYGNKSIRPTLEAVIIGQGHSGRTFVNRILNARMVWGIELEQGTFLLAGDDVQMEVVGGASTAGVQAGEENTIRVQLSCLQAEMTPTVNSTYASYIFPSS